MDFLIEDILIPSSLFWIPALLILSIVGFRHFFICSRYIISVICLMAPLVFLGLFAALALFVY